MPTYDYQCRQCGHITEVIHSMLEDGPSACERCGGVLRRVFHPTGIIFRGSGFYKTDSRPSTSGSTSADAPAKAATKGSDGAGSATGSTGGTSGGGSGDSSGSSAPASPKASEGA